MRPRECSLIDRKQKLHARIELRLNGAVLNGVRIQTIDRVYLIQRKKDDHVRKIKVFVWYWYSKNIFR